MALCPAFDPSGPFVGNLVALVDCHSIALGEDGWRALGSGSAFGAALGGLLTIYLALFGYRLILGEPLRLHDVVSAVVRIGIVLALATQWSMYRPMVYDLATRGPDELAVSLLSSSELGGADRPRLYSRVQAVNVALSALLHPVQPSDQGSQHDLAAVGAGADDQVHTPASVAPATSRLDLEALKAIASANSILLISTVAAAASVRVVIALLLALGPVFAAFLLFDSTRGLFAGWLRVLFGAILGVIAVSAVTSLELAVFEPQVAMLQQHLDTGQPLGSLPDEMQATAALFAFVMLATLVALARAAAGLRLPDAIRKLVSGLLTPPFQGGPTVIPRLAGPAGPIASQSAIDRAVVIADAARAAERRDAQVAATGSVRIKGLTEPLTRQSGSESVDVATMPLGERWRRSSGRPTMLAGLRDGR